MSSAALATQPEETVKLNGGYDDRIKALVDRGNYLLGQRTPMLSYWQDVAENFHPIRANFTYSRYIGDEYAANLSTSYPLLTARDLANNVGQMSRPTGQEWFAARAGDDEDFTDNESQRWLERATKTMRRMMYDRSSQFNKATKLTDYDFAVFGQGVMSCEINWEKTSLLFRNWHLRDMAWCEGPDGTIDFFVRKWEPTCREVYDRYGKDKVHREIRQKVEMDNGRRAYEKCSYLHIMTEAKNYDGPLSKRSKLPWVSIMVDTANRHLQEERPALTSYYTVPRWLTPSDSQYAYSAAVMCALPDARLIQAITYTLLKAGEKAVDPPMVAVGEAIRSDIAIYAGGVTYVDSEYDERLGEVLRPLTQDTKNLPLGLNMQERIENQLKAAFYLDKLTLPPIGHDMTAFEVSKRVQEYIRQALPLFEPIEQEYNDPLCSNVFTLGMSVHAFGPRAEIPESLSGADINFRFENPLTEARDQAITQTFIDSKGIIDVAASIDPSMAGIMNTEEALRDALRGRAVPSKWLKTEEQMAEERQQDDAQQGLMEAAQAAAGVGQVAQSIGQGAAALGEAGQLLGQ